MAERVAIYARVSTDDQAEKQTIASQLAACRDYCQRNGYEVVGEFLDEGVSGAVPFDERPEGKRLLEVAGDKIFQRVIVYCVDRLGRDVTEGIFAYKEFQRRKTPIEFVIQSFDDTPEGRFTFQVFLAVAELERGLIRRRTMAGRAQRVKAGKYQATQPPFGYDYVTCGQRKCEHPDCGTLVVNEEQAKAVRLMFKWAVEGVGLQAIATKLDEMVVQPPSPRHPNRQSHWGWHFTTVYKILKARRYIGEASYAGEPMTCPAIIERDVFDAAQAAMTKRRNNSPRNTKNFYMLQHLVWCRHCGNRYTPRLANDPKRGKARPIYHCYQRSKYGPKAGHEGVRWRWGADELERDVTGAVRRIYNDPEVFLRKVDLTVEQLKDEVSEQGRRVAEREGRLADLAQEEMRVIEMARKGYIDETAMLAQLDQVRAERQDVEHELSMARQASAEVDWVTEAADWFRELSETLPMTLGFVDEDTGAVAEPSREEWRELIARVVEKVWIEPDGSITLEGPFNTTNALTRFR